MTPTSLPIEHGATTCPLGTIWSLHAVCTFLLALLKGLSFPSIAFGFGVKRVGFSFAHLVWHQGIVTLLVAMGGDPVDVLATTTILVFIRPLAHPIAVTVHVDNLLAFLGPLAKPEAVRPCTNVGTVCEVAQLDLHLTSKPFLPPVDEGMAPSLRLVAIAVSPLRLAGSGVAPRLARGIGFRAFEVPFALVVEGKSANRPL
mmetsp:Transcript_51525/g.120115  ORF Transcript_51525/g.120115 Transcript_51525/m.120115 type:complete len:201 (-) Transcript_51525:976-1578(-)